MEVKKAIKRIFAVATATGLVGATLAGAFAAYDLSTYPAPFVTAGVLSPADSVIVVGANAKTTDVVGAIEIGASLQAAATTVVPVDVGTAVAPTVSDGVKIEKSGEKLNYYETIWDVDEKLTAEDLTKLLADRTYKENKGDNKNDVDYTQELQFDANSDKVVYEQDKDTDVTGSYLKLVKNKPAYTYVLEFDSPYAVYNNDTSSDAKADFDGSTIEMQGNKYTFTGAKISGGKLSELTMLSGETVKWLVQDQPLTVGDHTVMVVDVSDDSSGTKKCGVEVDGANQWVDAGSTETFGDLTVGVLDAITVHSKDYDQDTCELSIGSQEIKLSSGNEIDVNGKTIDDSEVDFTFSEADELKTIELSFTPSDDSWIKEKDAWTDPVFGNFKIMFEGMTKVTEDLKFTGGASSGDFVFLNLEGDKVTLPFTENNDESQVVLGDKHAEEFDATFLNAAGDLMNRTMLIEDGENCTSTTAEVTDCEGTYIFAVSTGGEARVLELGSINKNDDKVTIKDVTKGKSYTDLKYTPGAVSTLDVGFMEIQVKIDETNGAFTAEYIHGSDAKTSKEGVVALTDLGSAVGTEIQLEENKGNFGTDDANIINMTVEEGGKDGDKVAMTNVASVFNGGLGLDDCQQDSDNQCGATTWGTTVIWDSQNEDTATLSYPEEQAYANVFVAPLAASAADGSVGGTLNSQKVNKIPVGFAVLDSQAAAMTKNMIVVGGPCINTVADELEAPTGQCFAGYESGKAKIKAFDRKGKVAVLVAGMDAQDTLGASYVLRDYADYATKLKGTEVQVVVASLSDISVTSVSQ